LKASIRAVILGALSYR